MFPKIIILSISLFIQRRADRGIRIYHRKEIEDTPFTLVIAFTQEYGNLSTRYKTFDISLQKAYQYFKSDVLWTVHPQWMYCRNVSEFFDTPEAELNYFLYKMRSKWEWPDKRQPQQDIYCEFFS